MEESEAMLGKVLVSASLAVAMIVGGVVTLEAWRAEKVLSAKPPPALLTFGRAHAPVIQAADRR